MDWLTITVLTTTAGSDMVSDILIQAGSAGTMIEDRNDVALNQRPEGQWDIIDEEIARRMGEDVKVTGYYPADGTENDRVALVRSELARIRAMQLGFDAGRLEMSAARMDEEDWAENWKKNFKPFRITPRFIVRPGWEKAELAQGEEELVIDPGMAFGTGTHETTALCARLVEENVAPGSDVLDIGTGTGILAIAAARCGAKRVLATDIDPVAVRVAKENVETNGCGGRVEVRQGDLLAAADGAFDVVIANIIADVIIGMAAGVKRFVKDNGVFIASGITLEKQEAVLRSLRDAGFAIRDVREKGEWCAVLAAAEA